jgi:hypothetical protein
MKEPGMDMYCTPEPANPEMQFRAGSLATSLSLGFSTALVYFLSLILDTHMNSIPYLPYIGTVSRNASISIVD